MQDKAANISKKALREGIHSLLRERIIKGDLLPGSRLEAVQLAAELGVSRTPVREALLGLEVEGSVESDPNHGFFVGQLSRKRRSWKSTRSFGPWSASRSTPTNH
jgi:DNA-binding GntR family transcriptional regulator